MIKYITSVQLDTSDLANQATSRTMYVLGDVGSEFTAQVVQAATSSSVLEKYYNFETKEFVTGFVPQCVLKNVLSSQRTNIVINFPAGGNTTYNIILRTNPGGETEFSENLTSGGKHIVNKQLTQTDNTIVTFALQTTNTNTYTASPPAANIPSTGNPSVASNITVDIDWTLNNNETDANGFGLVLDSDVMDVNNTQNYNWDQAWYFSTTDTVNGKVNNSTQVEIDDITDIGEGMIITAGTGLSGTPLIKYIEPSKAGGGTLYLSTAQSFDDGVTLTFKAKGRAAINNAIGADIIFNPLTLTQAELTKTVRTDASSSTINLNGTYGVAKGATISGSDIVNTSTNAIQSVSASSSAGSIVMQVAQVITQNAIIYFNGCTNQMTLTGNNTIKKYPSSNRIIYLDIDLFIDPGVGS